MPDFTTDVDIDPSEYVNSCSRKEKEELAEILIEEGYADELKVHRNHGVKTPNVNDHVFWDSLEHLKKCRDLLSKTEEEFINNLSERFKHIR